MYGNQLVANKIISSITVGVDDGRGKKKTSFAKYRQDIPQTA